MRYRETIRCVTILGLSLCLSAVGAGRGFAQGGGGAGGGGGGGGSSGSGLAGGSGSSGTVIGGGFTGGGGSTSGGFTGSSGSSTGASFVGSSGGFGSSSSTGVPNQNTAWGAYYTNPLIAGAISVTGSQIISKSFGQAMYATVSTATPTTTSNSTSQGFGFNTFGQVRTPYYTATLSDQVPRVDHSTSELQATVTDVLRRSTSVQSLTPLRVRVDQRTVFLEGLVASDRMKQLAENIIRLTPGVYDIVNNIEVSAALPSPRGTAR